MCKRKIFSNISDVKGIRDWTIIHWKPVLWGPASSRSFVELMDTVCSGPKTKKIDQPDCYQQQVQQPGSVMVVSITQQSSVRFQNDTRCLQVSHLFLGRLCIFLQDLEKPHSTRHKGMTEEVEGAGSGQLNFYAKYVTNDDPTMLQTLERVCRKTRTTQFLKCFIPCHHQYINAFSML